MSWLSSAESYDKKKEQQPLWYQVDKCECEKMDGERLCDWCYSLDENDRQAMAQSSPFDLF